MIVTKKGDITLIKSGIILHQVNCQGVMGSGVARAIKEKWPIVFKEYKNFCITECTSNSASLLGKVLYVNVDNQIIIANCFSQNRYGLDKKRYTSYDALDICLQKVRKTLEHFKDSTIHFPLIGGGSGGGYWPIVQEIIEHNLPDPIHKTLWTRE